MNTTEIGIGIIILGTVVLGIVIFLHLFSLRAEGIPAILAIAWLLRYFLPYFRNSGESGS
jgi:hypothetical protein